MFRNNSYPFQSNSSESEQSSAQLNDTDKREVLDDSDSSYSDLDDTNQTPPKPTTLKLSEASEELSLLIASPSLEIIPANGRILKTVGHYQSLASNDKSHLTTSYGSSDFSNCCYICGCSAKLYTGTKVGYGILTLGIGNAIKANSSDESDY
jgi:hypothetical protein